VNRCISSCVCFFYLLLNISRRHLWWPLLYYLFCILAELIDVVAEFLGVLYPAILLFVHGALAFLVVVIQ
jgi:hypothetical protein